MHCATLSSKFQLSIPKQIREQLHIKAGQQFIFIPKGECLELVPRREIKDMCGILAGTNTKDIRDRNR